MHVLFSKTGIHNKLLLAVGILICVSLQNCKKEEICSPDYEGKDCLEKIRVKYIGIFTGYEPCSITGDATYSIMITPNDTDVTKVYFENLWFAQETNFGEVKSDGNIYIPEQEISNSFTFITGKAMMINGKLKVSYSISSGYFQNETDNCVWQQQ